MTQLDNLGPQIWDASPFSIVVTDYAAEPKRRKIIYVNRAFTDLTGFAATEVIGKAVTFMDGPMTDPNRTAECEAALKNSKTYEATFRHNRKDGSAYLSRATVAPLVERDGKAKFLMLVEMMASSIERSALNDEAPAVLPTVNREQGPSGREQVAQAMRISEIRYRRLFESARDGILILDAGTGEIIDVNPFMVTLLGYTREEYLGKSLWEIGAFKDIAENKAAFEKLQEQEYIRYEHLPLQTKSGKAAPVEFVSNVYLEDKRRVIQCNIRDITERKLAEKKLFEAQKMEALGVLTGGMAHDINNILGVIIGNLDLARPKLNAKGDADELIGEALSAAISGAELARRLLAFARRQPLQPEHTTVNGIVSEMTKLMRRTLGEDIEVSLKLASDVWPVMVDPVQFEAGLANLATNARDAMPHGGRLTITTRNGHLDAEYAAHHADVTPGDYAMIEISDDGTGMPPETTARIFEPFFTTKDRGAGTGLGLSMVFGFIKQSGGHINVYSEEGVGTTFRLYLPRADEGAFAAVEQSVPALALSRGETVLVVEDNPAMRRVVVRQVRDLGYHVLEAESARAALEVLSTEKVDMLFTDVVMPGGMTGLELARTAVERVPSLKVVVSSGFPEMKVGNNAFGGLRLLSKPYRKVDLARTLRETFDA